MNALKALEIHVDLNSIDQITFEDFICECKENYLSEGLEHWVYDIPRLPGYVLREKKNAPEFEREGYDLFPLRLPGRTVSQMVFQKGRYNICSKVCGETPFKKFDMKSENSSSALVQKLYDYFSLLCTFDDQCYEDAFCLLREMNEVDIAFDSTHHDNILIDYKNNHCIGFVDTFYVQRANSLFHFLSPIFALQFIEMHISSEDYPLLREPLLNLFHKFEQIADRFHLHHFQSCLYEGIYAEHHLFRAKLLARILEYPLERITGKLEQV
jgi:hypothetical protein